MASGYEKSPHNGSAKSTWRVLAVICVLAVTFAAWLYLLYLLK